MNMMESHSSEMTLDPSIASCRTTPLADENGISDHSHSAELAITLVLNPHVYLYLAI